MVVKLLVRSERDCRGFGAYWHKSETDHRPRLILFRPPLRSGMNKIGRFITNWHNRRIHHDFRTKRLHERINRMPEMQKPPVPLWSDAGLHQVWVLDHNRNRESGFDHHLLIAATRSSVPLQYILHLLKDSFVFFFTFCTRLSATLYLLQFGQEFSLPCG